ncbi:MAG: Serine/threonine-protein kinase PknD [Chroococcidiopsis sp. SAG 2025]|uniref:serine/threonine-protein kinase n=1 Tax=Chroococcidiopsis sp. SAG 2025 TaxID=171389 RepID=UPI002937249B|nr:serine/threonine-protein kinase [Chroococcidiopsis sp. SAG 2025]MDV2993228.1 Serine/threonine-protein kinase PknD [Chroococcidiopsis sp. SAG 2025]
MLGKIIGRRYQVVQILGSSSYCQTYLARTLDRNQPAKCVIKHLLSTDKITDLSYRWQRLFSREIAALEKLQSYSQVPQLLDYFDEDRQFYLVQEYIVGQPLSQLMPPVRVKWSQQQVIELLYEVLSILEIVHSQGLIHRDLKPNNLIRRASDGKLVLIDFGSVKQAWTQVVTSSGQTQANYAIGLPATIAVGTSGYMPSEQSHGRPRPNSDIYALGMIGIQALTGMQPTQLLEDAETGEMIWQHLVTIAPELTAILNKMVRYHFLERYQSTTEALNALAPLVANAPEKVNTATAQTSTTVMPLVAKPADKSAGAVSIKYERIASRLGTALGVTSAFALLLGSYYALRPTTNISPTMARSQIVEASHTTEPSTSPHTSMTRTLTGHTNAVWAVAIARDGRTLVSGSGDKTIKFWDIGSGQLLRTLTGNSAEVISLALSQDGQMLTSASYSAQPAVKVWDLSTQGLQHAIGNVSKVWSVAMSPDRQTLVSSNADASIKIWDLPTRTLRRTLVGHADTVWSVAISPNGKTLVSGSKDRTIKIWDLRTGALRRTLLGHTDRVRSVAISPDGQTLVSSSWDKTIGIWQLHTGRRLRTLTGHSDYINSVAISPDSQMIASGSDDRQIKLWQLNTGELLTTFSGHQGNVNSLSFTPDGKSIISGSEDKTVKVWSLQGIN